MYTGRFRLSFGDVGNLLSRILPNLIHLFHNMGFRFPWKP